MRNDKKNLHPTEVYEMITESPKRNDYTYIIMGKSGPTGKSRLLRNLKEIGLNAFELSENLYNVVHYDENNHFIVDDQIRL